MTGMREHDARAYADASTEHDAPAYATDGRTDGLTQKHSPNAESSPSVSRAGGQNESTPSQPVSDLSVPASQPNPSTEDGWVRFYFDDADPVAECACGWHTHGDSASDAFGAWWKHRREHDDAAGEQRSVVLSARVDLDLDQIEARANAATPGPWEIFRYGHGGGRIHVSGGDGRERTLIADVSKDDDVASVYNEGDREFLFAAREDVPALVAEVRRLRAQLDDVTTDNLLAEAQDEIEDLRGERDAARAEAEELRQAYRTVCDYAEQHDATRAMLNEARAEVERLREGWRGESEHGHSNEPCCSCCYRVNAERAEAARVREALQAVRELLDEWVDACGCECTACDRLTERVATLLDAALDGAE